MKNSHSPYIYKVSSIDSNNIVSKQMKIMQFQRALQRQKSAIHVLTNHYPSNTKNSNLSKLSYDISHDDHIYQNKIAKNPYEKQLFKTKNQNKFGNQQKMEIDHQIQYLKSESYRQYLNKITNGISKESDILTRMKQLRNNNVYLNQQTMTKTSPRPSFSKKQQNIQSYRKKHEDSQDTIKRSVFIEDKNMGIERKLIDSPSIKDIIKDTFNEKMSVKNKIKQKKYQQLKNEQNMNGQIKNIKQKLNLNKMKTIEAQNNTVYQDQIKQQQQENIYKKYLKNIKCNNQNNSHNTKRESKRENNIQLTKYQNIYKNNNNKLINQSICSNQSDESWKRYIKKCQMKNKYKISQKTTQNSKKKLKQQIIPKKEHILQLQKLKKPYIKNDYKNDYKYKQKLYKQKLNQIDQFSQIKDKQANNHYQFDFKISPLRQHNKQTKVKSNYEKYTKSNQKNQNNKSNINEKLYRHKIFNQKLKTQNYKNYKFDNLQESRVTRQQQKTGRSRSKLTVISKSKSKNK